MRVPYKGTTDYNTGSHEKKRHCESPHSIEMFLTALDDRIVTLVYSVPFLVMLLCLLIDQLSDHLFYGNIVNPAYHHVSSL